MVEKVCGERSLFGECLGKGPSAPKEMLAFMGSWLRLLVEVARLGWTGLARLGWLGCIIAALVLALAGWLAWLGWLESVGSNLETQGRPETDLACVTGLVSTFKKKTLSRHIPSI